MNERKKTKKRKAEERKKNEECESCRGAIIDFGFVPQTHQALYTYSKGYRNKMDYLYTTSDRRPPFSRKHGGKNKSMCGLSLITMNGHHTRDKVWVGANKSDIAHPKYVQGR